MGRKTFVLIVADETTDRALVRATLERELVDVAVTEAHSRSSFLKLLDVATYDVVLTAHKLADLNALEVIDELRERGSQAPVLLLVSTGTEDIAVEAMKRGAADYVIHDEPFIGRLPFAVEHVAWAARLEQVKTQAETDRTKLEKQLHQAKRMEALDTLAGGIAHDLNNILLAIFGFGELARDELLESTVARRNLEEVLRAAERAKRLVTQILTFSRQGLRHREPVDVGAAARRTLAVLRSGIRPEIVIREKIDGRTGRVHADETQLQQVITNLVTNAADAMREEGGVLEVTVDEVDVDAELAAKVAAEMEGLHVRLSVRDTGHGMEEGTRERIFDPFFSTKGAGGGTGLGLSVVYGVVRGHGGAVHVDSRRGVGTVAQVYLPVVPSASGVRLGSISS